MPYSKSKYSAEVTNELNGRAAIVLAESKEAMTIDEIQAQDMVLKDVTMQKMTRVLNHLVEMGMVAKAKSKQKGKMVYKSLAVMADEGYNTEEYLYGKNMQDSRSTVPYGYMGED